MAAKDDQELINQIQRVANSQGWDVVATDRSGPTIRVTVEHAKPSEPFTNTPK